MAERGDSNYRPVLKTGNLLIFRHAQNASNATFAVFTHVIHTRFFIVLFAPIFVPRARCLNCLFEPTTEQQAQHQQSQAHPHEPTITRRQEVSDKTESSAYELPAQIYLFPSSAATLQPPLIRPATIFQSPLRCIRGAVRKIENK